MSELTLGEKIKTLRKEQGLTLEQVGDAVGVGKSTVRKWENAIIANMRKDKLVSLAKALHTTPAYLMGWKDEPTFAEEERIRTCRGTIMFWEIYSDLCKRNGVSPNGVAAELGFSNATCTKWKKRYHPQRDNTAENCRPFWGNSRLPPRRGFCTNICRCIRFLGKLSRTL